MDAKKNRIEPSPDGLFYEARVSSALGVPRKLLARLRSDHLTAGVDYVRREANAVALTAPGLARMENLLQGGDEGLTNGKPPPTAGKPAPNGSLNGDVPAGPFPKEMMVVVKIPQREKRLLCRKQNQPVDVDAMILVRVRESKNFEPGMAFEAIGSGEGIWQFHNRPGGGEGLIGRLPRRKGTW